MPLDLSPYLLDLTAKFAYFLAQLTKRPAKFTNDVVNSIGWPVTWRSRFVAALRSRRSLPLSLTTDFSSQFTCLLHDHFGGIRHMGLAQMFGGRLQLFQTIDGGPHFGVQIRFPAFASRSCLFKSLFSSVDLAGDFFNGAAQFLRSLSTSLRHSHLSLFHQCIAVLPQLVQLALDLTNLPFAFPLARTKSNGNQYNGDQTKQKTSVAFHW